MCLLDLIGLYVANAMNHCSGSFGACEIKGKIDIP